MNTPSVDQQQVAAAAQIERQSDRYGKSHILADTAEMEVGLGGVNLAPAAKALDVATGGGHAAVYLARRGWRVPEGEVFAFGTNVRAPSFVWTELVIADREKLLAEFPGHTELIKRLTARRESPNPALPAPDSVTPAAGALLSPPSGAADR